MYHDLMGQDGIIGVFDSGVGGISVLKHLVKLMPHERFVFYGDSANAPYGGKPAEWVLDRSRLIACNTATSVAAATLRAEHEEVPIIGIEPALKPAAEADRHDRILVMATETTIRLDKFHRLARDWGSRSDVVAVPCPGLADLIELGDLESTRIRDLLEERLGQYRGRVDGIVLGCTHYPFVARQIRAVMGDVPLYDGGAGTARQTRRLLEERDSLAPASQEGTVEFRSSNADPGQIELYHRFYRLPLRTS